MATEKFKRKIAAILSADVKGYSRLMGQDEEGTLRTLNAYKEVIIGFIQQYQGRMVGTAGDSVLAEFASVVDAVRCAMEIQNELKSRNIDLPENRRMEFRIGINLGDVVEDGDTIYGDGVNVAARLESLADAGGICISGIVYDLIEKKLSLGYEYLGEQNVKNIEKPVRVYRVLLGPEETKEKKGLARKAKDKKRFFLAAGIAVVALAGVIIWQFAPRSFPHKAEVASKEKMAFPLPNKPSIAVLPFVNMSADKEQEYFSDGITEDLITDLSKISGLLVIARNSTFTYKGKAVKIKQVAEELGVRYVLEGSVRRVGDEIRINAQLIDTMTGHHLWAERYDGTIKKIFQFQDQINHKIVSALALKLTGAEKQIIADKGTDNAEAYEAILQGYGHYLRMNPDDLAKAAQSFKKAIELDPNYSKAYAALALTYRMATTLGLSKVLESSGLSWFELRLRTGQYLKQAMKNPTSTAHIVSGSIYLARRQYAEAVQELEKAVALDANDPACLSIMAAVLNSAGKPKEAIDFINRAMRLDPHNPSRYVFQLGAAQFMIGNLEESAVFFEKARRLNPGALTMEPWLASIYAHLGRKEEAHVSVDKIKKGWGETTSLRTLSYHFPFKERAVADRFAEGLIKAGMGGKPADYFPAFRENRLTGDEIRKLLSNSRITGVEDGGGQQWWIESKKGEELSWRGGGEISSDKGKFRVEGDLMCVQYQKKFWGIEYCQTVFRDPKGSYAQKNEYFFCTDWGFSPWSIERQ